MAVELSILSVADSSRSPLALISSLDNQTLTTDRFELIVIDQGLEAGERSSLKRVANRRPNVRLVEPGMGWFDTAVGDRLQLADPNQKFFPESLERLIGFATAHGLDIVAGRPVQPRQPLHPPFVQDATELDESAATAALTSTVVLVTRHRARPTATGFEIDAAGARVGVLASYPATDEAKSPTAEGASATVTLGTASLDWDGDELVVSTSGAVPSGGQEDMTPLVLARQLGTHLSFLISTTGDVTRSTEREGLFEWRASSRLNPRTAAGGSPLPPGLWEFDVIVAGRSGASGPVTVRSATCPPALLNGVVVTSGLNKNGAVQLDVGSSRYPLVDQADATLAVVTESARGSVLELQLPSVHVRGEEAAQGLIGFGRLKTPASLKPVNGTVVFTAFVSGLAGITAVEAQFGRSGFKPTGISLEISGTGQMVAVATPAEAPGSPPSPARSDAPAKPKPAASGKKRRKKKRPQAKGPVARLRRAVPAPLEPVARKISRLPIARRLYRRVTGLSR